MLRNIKEKILRKYYIIIETTLLIIIGLGWYLNQSSSQPNVLLITIDALRPDHLGCYGYKRNTSPNIDKIAKEGVIFTQAIAQSGWTGSSVFSILTSTNTYTHSVFYCGDVLNPSIPTLAQVLRDNNYLTTAINTCEIGNIFGRGFDRFISIKNEKADKVTFQAVNCLKKNKNKKFFLWVHYLDPHGPYRPPPPYNQVYIKDEFYKRDHSLPISIAKSIYFPYGVIPKYILEGNINDVSYYISQYDGEIRFSDEQIGILLKELEKLDLIKNTLIVITSDHGEYLGEHNFYFNHSIPLYDELVKVPLIIRYKDIIPKQKRINCQIRSIDIMPTILDILRIKISKGIEGISLFPLIQGKQCPYLYAFSCYRNITASVRTEDYKLIYTNKDRFLEFWKEENPNFTSCPELIEYRLYNLKTDPSESVDLINTEKKKISLLRKELNKWMKCLQSNLSKLKSLDTEQKERLKSLGYTQ